MKKTKYKYKTEVAILFQLVCKVEKKIGNLLFSKF